MGVELKVTKARKPCRAFAPKFKAGWTKSGVVGPLLRRDLAIIIRSTNLRDRREEAPIDAGKSTLTHLT